MGDMDARVTAMWTPWMPESAEARRTHADPSRSLCEQPLPSGGTDDAVVSKSELIADPDRMRVAR